MILVPVPNVGVRILVSPQASVLAFDEANVLHAAAAAPRAGNVAEILATNIKLVVVYWNTNICLAAVCELVGPTAEQAARVQITAQHNVDSVEHFEARGFVFDGHSNYRLRIVTKIDAEGRKELDGEERVADQTEFAFFRTEGPPKLVDLTIPEGREADQQLQLKNVQGQLVRNDGTVISGQAVLASELNELGVYVHQTLPATVPASKESPDLPRPIYRAYDLGVDFNENYVQLMYRLDARDLALYLFDQNNQPLRDPEGRLLVVRAGWDVSDDPVSRFRGSLTQLGTKQLPTGRARLSVSVFTSGSPGGTISGRGLVVTLHHS